MNRPGPRADRRWIIGCLFAVGTAIFFYAGILLGRQQTVAEQSEKHPPTIAGTLAQSPVRNVFSPAIISDPYFLGEQRKLVEAFERTCKVQKTHCETARKARAALELLN